MEERGDEVSVSVSVRWDPCPVSCPSFQLKGLTSATNHNPNQTKLDKSFPPDKSMDGGGGGGEEVNI